MTTNTEQRTTRPAIIPRITAAQKTRRSPLAHRATDERLGRIVRVLMNHATVIASGTKIAEEIGTTRSEIWRLIQQLRHLGVDIAGHPATGYRLRAVPDLLLPEMIAPLVKGTIFAKPDAKNFHHYYTVGSTNSEAMNAASEGAPEGSVFFAEEQLAGRGRGAHTWHSARSAGVYCSVILRPPIPPSDALLLSLAAGLAVHAAVADVAEIPIDLKWPNDLLLGGKKFCGILTEMNAEATRVRHLVIGIGINVNQTKFPVDLRDIATSLRAETRTEWSRVELCAALLKSLDREYRALLADGSAARDSVLKRFEERSSSSRGRKVRIDENGELEGVTEGLDARGFLQVRTAEGLRTVLSGTVRLIE
ncbi:MAG: biotin--[acetyl-CoA-carboxylase] ligase [Terriglobales bacterium]|jgi:BirA family biotin operon repressor/biotin-[acetyl-CoA-carboxylase] ligase